MFWILIVAFALRSYLLTLDKPVHFDEGINGHFVQTIVARWISTVMTPQTFMDHFTFYILAVWRKDSFGIRHLSASASSTGLMNLAAIWVVGLHRRFVGRSGYLCRTHSRV